MRDYFALLGFARHCELDEKALHQAYLSAQRLAHPDRQTDAAARMAALQTSADLNQAYRILKHPLRRAEHLLALEGIRVGGEQDTVRPSSTLLMESMDFRERLMEATSPEAINALRQEACQALDATRAAFVLHYHARQFTDAAHHAIRWRFLEKLLEEIRVQSNRLL